MELSPQQQLEAEVPGSTAMASSSLSVAPSPSLMPSSSTPQLLHGLDVPLTPQDPSATGSSPTSPRHASVTRDHGMDADELESKSQNRGLEEAAC